MDITNTVPLLIGGNVYDKAYCTPQVMTGSSKMMAYNKLYVTSHKKVIH